MPSRPSTQGPEARGQRPGTEPREPREPVGYWVLEERGAERGVGVPASDTLGGVQGAPPSKLDLAHLPPDDPDVYRMLQEADTIGVFQVESRAQMATLPRLRPACFYDIVVEVALIRPGPIVGQMVHPYLRRRQGLEPVTYPHPALEPILKRTLGVPLFQEQLLRMAMVAAGFSGGEAEELRRAFGFKRSVARMKTIEEKLRAGMARQGLTGEAAESIVRSIASFALYGFPESHAASFALLVYASAYLKAHYPAAFYAAMLDNYPMGFYHPATLVKDAQRRGVRFAPIDVQRSRWRSTIEADGAVRLGLRYVAGLREEVGMAIESGGRRPGPSLEPTFCPKCGCDDPSMLEDVRVAGATRRFCNVCAHEWTDRRPGTGGQGPGAGDRGQTSVGAGFRLRQGPGGRAEARRAEAVSRLDQPEYPSTQYRLPSFLLHRGPHRAHGRPPRRAGHAGRHRRARVVRPRPPVGALAGRARRPSVRRALRAIGGRGRAGLESARCGGRLQPARSTRGPGTRVPIPLSVSLRSVPCPRSSASRPTTPGRA